MSEAVSQKSGWTTVAFGDVVKKVTDKVDPEESGLERYVAGEHMDTDDLRIRRWGEIGDDYLGPAFHMRFKPGQVLYGSRRTYLRKVALADFEGITANTTYVLESKNPEILLPEMLPFIMQAETFHEHSRRESKGSVNPYVNFSDLAWYEFALPPLEEQRRIVEVLQAAESTAQRMAELETSLRRVFTARFEEYLSNADERAAAIPVAKLLREPPRNGLSPTTNSDELGLQTVSISAVSKGRFKPVGNIKFAEVEHDKASQFFVRAGDVFAIRGNGNRYITGKAGIAEQDYEGLFYPDLLIRMRFDHEQVIPRFALAQWNLPSVHRRLVARAKSSNGIYKVNGQDIRAHTLLVPSIEEQEQVLAEIDEIETQREKCDNRRASAAQVKAAVLQQLEGLRDA